MDSVIHYKDGVLFTKIAPAGFRILSAIDQVSKRLALDLVITSACDGEHSGPDDPHHRGEAYDVRSHDLTLQEQDDVLDGIMSILGWTNFFGFLEAAGTDNAHFHFQVKKGTVYP